MLAESDALHYRSISMYITIRSPLHDVTSPLHGLPTCDAVAMLAESDAVEWEEAAAARQRAAATAAEAASKAAAALTAALTPGR